MRDNSLSNEMLLRETHRSRLIIVGFGPGADLDVRPATQLGGGADWDRLEGLTQSFSHRDSNIVINRLSVRGHR